METNLKLVIALYLSICFLLSACGGNENSTNDLSSRQLFIPNSGKTIGLEVLPSQFLAFDQNTEKPTELVSVNRVIDINQYDVISAPELDMTQTIAKSVITGIGFDAFDLAGAPLAVTMALVAREVDPKTGFFKSGIRTFSAPRANLEGAQEFVIQNENSNILLTGLGLRGFNVRIKNLQVLRKPLSEIFDVTRPPENKTFVTVDQGFAVIGILIKIPAKDLTKIPFIQDAAFFSAELKEIR